MKGREVNVIEGMPNDAYHAAEGISASGLKLIGKSPLHYWGAYLDPDREPREETPALKLGTAIHCAVLEPMRFTEEYIVVPEDAPRRPTSAQMNAKKPSDDTVNAILWWRAFDAENTGKNVLSRGEFSTCMKISERLNRHPAASVLFRSGVAELSMFWEDPETGVLCKCRPDWLIKGMAILDVKSTADAGETAFARSVWNYEYHLQAAWYLDGVRQCLGNDAPQAFIFAAFEKDAPHAVAFYSADGEMVSLGRREYKRRLQIYAECKSKNFWPGYPAGIQSLSLPAWAIKAANDNSPQE